jgi:hypothetical protein
MKTRFSFSARPKVIALAASLIVPFVFLHMADADPFAPSAAQGAQADPNPEATRVNMQFDDMDLKAIVSFLRDKFQGANFMVQPKAETVRVTLNVRNVGFEQALQAIAFASEGRVAVERMDYHFYGLVLTDSTGNPAQKPTCRVFNLSGAQDFSDAHPDAFLDEIKNSVQETVVALHNADPAATVVVPELQFHRSTRLLVAVGKPDSLAIVEQFVVALGGRSTEMAQPIKNGFPGVPGAPTGGGFGGFGGSGWGVGGGTTGTIGGGIGSSAGSVGNGGSGSAGKASNNAPVVPPHVSKPPQP